VSKLSFLSPGGPNSAFALGYSIVTAGKCLKLAVIMDMTLTLCISIDLGEGQLKWWSLRNPNLVSFSIEQPEGKGRVTSLTSVYGEVITGDSVGDIYIWKVRPNYLI
jgi:hypothetical protein